MKTIKELEVLKKKGKRCVDFVDNTLKDVLGLMNSIGPIIVKEGHDICPNRVVEAYKKELKAKIEGK